MRKVLSVLALSLGMVAGGVQADPQTAQKLRGMGVSLSPELWADVEGAAWDDFGAQGMAVLLAKLVAWNYLSEETGLRLCDEQGDQAASAFLYTLVRLREGVYSAKEKPVEDASKQ